MIDRLVGRRRHRRLGRCFIANAQKHDGAPYAGANRHEQRHPEEDERFL
ncbi:MAG: hypothetical protein KDI31_07875 [Pseudomonadales bacterium]|nr:hypothetical protein [Pseudomonadales bacterium]